MSTTICPAMRIGKQSLKLILLDSATVVSPGTADHGILRAPPLQNLPLPRAMPGMIRGNCLLRFGALAIDDVIKHSAATSNGICRIESTTNMAGWKVKISPRK